MGTVVLGGLWIFIDSHATHCAGKGQVNKILRNRWKACGVWLAFQKQIWSPEPGEGLEAGGCGGASGWLKEHLWSLGIMGLTLG